MSEAVLHKEYEVAKDDYVNAGKASSKIKEVLKQVGLDPKVIRNIAVACYEAEINLVIHTNGGRILMDLMDDGTVNLVFSDSGPGIEDIEKAMTPGFSTADEEARSLGFGAGMGLPNIKRVSDTFDIKTGPEGTTLSISFKGE